MTQRPGFDVVAYSPAAWPHPGVAVSAARAGGTGVLDLEFCDDPVRASANFARLLAESGQGQVGLRATPSQLQLASDMLAAAPKDRPLWLIAGGTAAEAIKVARALKKARSSATADRLLLETVQPEVKAGRLKLDGLIACGVEAPGWGGEDSSYILAQKLLDGGELPVWVRGGIGPCSAAALRAAGAAGVVLDDQLLACDESPLSGAHKAELARLNGGETRVLGEFLGAPCRVYGRPGSAPLKRAQQLLLDAEAADADTAVWKEQIEPLIGWGDDQLWPVGQGVGVANALGERRVARLVRRVQKDSFSALRKAATLRHLDEGAPLAASHGTRFPLVQGPMTRVSDNADFAVAVSKGGALPFLALALMRGDQVDALLSETARKAGDLPWGVGMLGFVPQALRDEQCQAIWKHKPPFALIAGGRPDQAAAFEERGIPAYIHVPAPQLLKMYYEQGARRFVFEGRECGGHIGPIGSFPLWEQMIATLLEVVPESEAADVHVLFAGGLNDARSGAMLAAMTAPLAERGVRVGGLMGTAYLFTKEIVESGAIVQGFQDEALACRHTTSLETGPGHATRCVDTAFAKEFHAQRREMLAAARPAEEIRDALEDLNLGRLRLASKGRTRDADGKIVEIPPEQQKREGMYMIGQVATLRDEVTTVEQLHSTVCTTATRQLVDHESEVEARAQAANPSDIAVVGIGVVLPSAGDADHFWHNVLQKVSVIREVPQSRWDWRLYFDEDKSARDKVYSRWGGFLDEIAFDPTRYGIPPRSMKSIDPMQLLSLECTVRALEDAGLDPGLAKGGSSGLSRGEDFDRENTSIIVGAGGGVGDLGMQYGVRAELPRFVASPDDEAWERLPEWTNESFAGVLQNVAAGRVANRLNFGGLNFTVDAACGSSLAAVTLAAQELEAGRSNLAIAGGVDTVQGPHGFLCFSKTQALSPKGQARTFDRNADGIVISEGVAMVVLKRLADAEADGDRIYAVIKGAAGSSDGKALGMTAPRPEGQMRALNRVYAKAGFGPDTVELVEAHGTGTPVGDRAEAETITRTWAAHGAPPKSVALGSVKTILGHTKCAAGVSGLIKVALSLHHRTLPAHVGVDEPIDTIASPDSPAYLLRDARPWLAHSEHPRRGAVSAFGFGGTNFHTVLEEYRGNYATGECPGGRFWPSEPFVFRAPDRDSLVRQVEHLLAALEAGDALPLAAVAASLATEAEKAVAAPVAAAFVAESHDKLREQLHGLRAHLVDNQPLPSGLQCNLERRAPRATALLFPGQGAQTVGMGTEAAVYLDPVRAAVEHADHLLAGAFRKPLSSLMWPEAAFDEATRRAQQEALTDTRHAQPAIGALSLGYLDLLRHLDVDFNAVAGHSYGEYTALHAAGVLDAEAFLRLSTARGAAMAEASESADGAMAAIQASRETVSSLLPEGSRVWLANHNAPEQCVISGAADAVDAVIAAAEARSLRVVRLPVSGAFHTELVAGAQDALSRAIDDAPFAAPRCAVYSNRLGAAYPDDPEAIREDLKQHMLAPVEFVAELQAMADDGAELFIECGPRQLCAGMARASLAERGVRIVSLDGQGGGLRGLLSSLCELAVAGVDLPLSRLFADRVAAVPAWAQLKAALRPAELSATSFLLSGGCARPKDDPEQRANALPPLTLESREAARRQRASAPAAAATPEPTAATPPTGEASALSSAAPRAADPAAPPSVPASVPASSASAPVTAPGFGEEVLAAYQQTMQQFLALQEQVMTRVLSGAPAQSAVPAAAPSPTDMPAARGAEAFSASAPWPAPSQPATAPVASSAAAATPPAASPSSAPEAAAAEPQPTAAGPAFDAAATLVALVADRTGYPEDMIALEADLEADLGIDSIKRVEIVGAFAKQVPAAVAEAMNADMERYTRAKSLQALIDALPAVAQASGEGAAKAAPDDAVPDGFAATASGQAAGPAFDAAATLVALVADRTGYPEDMIALEADLEADLGIDSIKRVEIVGAFAKQVPAAVAEAMNADMERYTRAKSLQALIDALPGGLPEDSPPPASGGEKGEAVAARAPARAESGEAEVPTPPGTDAEAEAVPRFVLKPRAIAPIADRVALQGCVLALGDRPDGVFAQALRKACDKAGLVLQVVDRAEPEAVAEAVAATGHALAGVVLLHGLMPSASGDEDGSVHWSEDLAAGRAAVEAAFACLRGLSERHSDLRLVAATRLGGTLGRGAIARGSAVAGGLVGLLNCARQEYPEAHLLPVDFNGQTPESIAETLLAELASSEALPEVGYVGDTRYTSATVPELLSDTRFAPHIEPEGDWVVLATGGARGITSSILQRLARPGMTMVLAGRSALPEPEDAALAAATDADALRRHLLEAARSRGEKPRPAEIDRAVARILSNREIRAAVAALEAAGVTVDYRTVDVRDSDAVAGLVASVYERHGRLDAVLHGAGIIEDKLIADKTAESFARVFATKVDSAVALAQSVQPDSLKLFALFTSVAGRYGNRGQSDYAAANEALNRIAWKLAHDWPGCRVLSLNWGPWDAGMATEAVKAAFRSRGVLPIPLHAGCDYFLKELACGPRHEVEIVVGQGPWQAAEGGIPASARTPAALPLVRSELRMGAGGALELNQEIAEASDPWLADHRLDGVGVVPATVAAEWMAEVAEAGWPGWRVVEIRDLRVLSGIRIEEGRKRLCVRARASSHSDAAEQVLKLEILDPGAKNRVCYRASVRIVERLPSAEGATPPEAEAPGDSSLVMPATDAYRKLLFHGPMFQRLQGDLQLAPTGIDAWVRPSLPADLGGQGERWLFDPALMDCIPQLAWIWSRQFHDTSALPSSFGSIRRFACEDADDSGERRICFRVRDDASAEYTHYDAWVLDGAGRLRFIVEHAESNASKALNRLAGE